MFIIFAYTYIPIYISFKIFSYIHIYISTYYICMYVCAEHLMYTTEQMYICMYKEHLYFFPFKDSFRFFLLSFVILLYTWHTNLLWLFLKKDILLIWWTQRHMLFHKNTYTHTCTHANIVFIQNIRIWINAFKIY